MRNLLLAIGFIFLLQTGDKSERILRLNIRVSQIELDEANNFFVVEGNKITMYSPSGEIEYAYSNYFTVRLDNIDVSYPDKILLFYQQDQKIALLNQHFRTEPEPFFLNEKGYENISAACLSDDGNVWIFDEKEQKLIKLTETGAFITESKKITESLDEPVNQVFMKVHGGEIYLSDPGQGIHIFDAIGEYQETLPLKGATHFRISDGRLLYVVGKNAIIYDLKTNKKTSIEIPVRNYKTVALDIQGKNLVMYVADLNKLDVRKMRFVEN